MSRERDEYIDDGAEDLDDREAAGYYDERDDYWFNQRADAYAEQFDTREEANGER